MTVDFEILTSSESTIIDNLSTLLNTEMVDGDGNNFLFCATSSGFLGVFKALEKHDDKELVRKMVNSPNLNGSTPLHHLFTESGESLAEIAEILLKYAGDINIQNNDKKTPLHFIVEDENEELVNLFVNKGASVNIKNNTGRTPLHYACEKNNIKIVEILLGSDGIDINLGDNDGKTALDLAKNNEDIKRLFDAYNEKEVKPEEKRTLAPSITESNSKKSEVELYQALLRENLKGAVLDKSLYNEYVNLIDKLDFIKIKPTPVDNPPLTQIFGDENQSHVEEKINNNGKFSYFPGNHQQDDPGRINEIIIPRLTATGEHSTTEFEVIRLNRDGELLSYSVKDEKGTKLDRSFDEQLSQIDKNWLNTIDKSKSIIEQKSLDETHNSGAVIKTLVDGNNRVKDLSNTISKIDEREMVKGSDNAVSKKPKPSIPMSLDNIDDLILGLNKQIKTKEEYIRKAEYDVAYLKGEKERLKKDLKRKKIRIEETENTLSSKNKYWIGHNHLKKQVDEFVKQYNQDYPKAANYVHENKKEKIKLEQARDNALFDKRVAMLLKEEVNLGYKKEEGKFVPISANDLDKVYLRYRDYIREQLQIKDFSKMTTDNVKAQIDNIKTIIRVEILNPLSIGMQMDIGVRNNIEDIRKQIQKVVSVGDTQKDESQISKEILKVAENQRNVSGMALLNKYR